MANSLAPRTAKRLAIALTIVGVVMAVLALAEAFSDNPDRDTTTWVVLTFVFMAPAVWLNGRSKRGGGR
jgi:dipeptide/tripeptide permease